MKILKNTIIIIISLVVVILIIAAFVPSDFEVEREVIINKPLTEVFDYVKYLKNQENYSVWSKIDPNMKREYTGVDGTVGFVSAWDSDNPDAGKGEQEIIKIDEGKI